MPYFAEIADYLSEALIAIDKQHIVIGWNVAAERIYGWKASEVMGKPLDDFLQTNYQNITEDQTRQTGTWSGEMTQARKDGTRIPVLSSVSVINNEQGTPIGFISINRDISEQKWVEANQRENQSILATAEEVAQIGSWKWDLRTQKVTWSEQMFHLFGVEPKGFDGDVNHVISERIHPEDVARVQESNRKVLEEDTPSPLSYRIVLPDGAERTVWAQGKLFRDEAGHPLSLTGYVQDITERVRAEKQIIQMKRLYATLRQVNQTIVRVKNHDELYQSICDMTVQFGKFSLAWIGLLDDASGEVRPVAASGFNLAQWPFGVVNIREGEFKDGLVARSIRTSKVVTSDDLGSDNRTKAVQKQFIKHGYHSSAAVPFRLMGKTIGILSLTSRELGLFKADEEVRLLDEMGLDISFALDTMETEAERKQTDKALRQSEQKFSALFEKSVFATSLSRLPDGVMVDVNEAFERTFGYTKQEVIGRTSLELGINPDAKGRAQILAELKEHGSVRNQEMTLKTKSNEVRVFSVNVDLVGIDDQKYILNTTQDITQRKQAEEQVLAGKAKMDTALNSMTDAVFISDTEGRFINFNEAFATFHKFKNKDECAKTLSEYPEFLEVFTANGELAALDQWVVSRALRGEMGVNVEYSLRRKDTGETWVGSYSFAPIRDKDGAITGSVVVGRDITESKLAEQNLRKSEERYRLISENAADVIWVLDPTAGKFTYVSPSVEKLRGYTPAEVMAQPISEALTPESLKWVSESIATNLRDFLARGSGTESFVTKVDQPRKDGSIVHTEVTTTYLFNQEGQVEVIGVSRDITERKRAEEALKHSEERYRHTLDDMLEGCQIIDFDWRYVYVNDAAIKQGHQTREALINHTMMEAYPGIESSEMFGVLRDCIKNRVVRQMENVFVYPDGAIGYFELSFQPVAEGAFILSIDITKRKQAEFEAQRRTEDLILINTLNDAVNRGEDLDGIAEVFTREARNVFACQGCSHLSAQSRCEIY
jgi:PAS domain S-box-containing protein